MQVQASSRGRHRLRRALLLSLSPPIQAAGYLVSDPFGTGSNIFGTGASGSTTG